MLTANCFSHFCVITALHGRNRQNKLHLRTKSAFFQIHNHPLLSLSHSLSQSLAVWLQTLIVQCFGMRILRLMMRGDASDRHARARALFVTFFSSFNNTEAKQAHAAREVLAPTPLSAFFPALSRASTTACYVEYYCRFARANPWISRPCEGLQ